MNCAGQDRYNRCMRYRQWAPTSALSPLVDCWWTLEGVAHEQPQLILPDGHVELVFHLGHRPWVVAPNGHRDRQAPALIAGQLSGGTLAFEGSVCTVGVRLRAAAARVVIRSSAEALNGRLEPLHQVNSELARRVSSSCGPSNVEECIHAIEQALLPFLISHPPDSATAAAAALIDATGGALSIDQLSTSVGISPRSLERRFVREVGVPPKVYSRLVRFQRAVAALSTGDRRLIEVALDSGYSDQAHFTREFHSFAGVPPTRWLTNEQELSRYFTRVHRARESRRAAVRPVNSSDA